MVYLKLKNDATEHGEECLLTCYDGFSQTISLIKLLAAFFPTAFFPQIIE